MENQGKQYTIDEVIRITIANLQSLTFPVMLSEQYGVPIQKSIGNLNVVLEMLDQLKKKEAEKAEKAEEKTEKQEEQEDGREADAE